jgi:AcrR family transcriptional regulator
MDHWVAPFLEALADTGVVTDAAKAAGINSTTVYARRRGDADFAAAWEQALEDSADALEREARRRAVRGVQEPVVYQGQLTPVWERDAQGRVVTEDYDVTVPTADGSTKVVKDKRPKQMLDPDGRPVWLTVTKHSDALLALLLKGRRKRVFADRTELTGADGGPVQVDEGARAARVAQLMAIAQKRRELAAMEQQYGDLA